MINAFLTATSIDYSRLAEIARGLERHIRLVSPRNGAAHGTPRPVHLHFTANRLPEPIVVDAKQGVAVSTWDIEGVCQYVGIDETQYLLICSLVGIAHWRVLDLNPLLRIEDLRHPKGVHCVYVEPDQVHDFALLLDGPAICRGCTGFYHCLGADTELLALREVVNEVNEQRQTRLEESEEPSEFESDY